MFPSFKLHGKQPRLGSMIVQDYIRPAAVVVGVSPEDCPKIRVSQLEARAYNVLNRERTRPGSGAAHASSVTCRDDHALRSQEQPGTERPSRVH